MVPSPSLPVAVPLLAAAGLSALGRVLPRWVLDTVAVLTTASVTWMCAALALGSVDAPIVYWFGGWEVSSGVALGISFVVDPLGAGLAALVALLCTTSLAFAWHYFESVGHLFHVLLLLFCAAMVGYCLTGDLFNLFVFFELMGVSAYALTGYKVEEPQAIQGALNFGVTNSAGGVLILMSIGLLYGRTGALNLARLGESLAAGPVDSLVLCAFVLLAVGLCTKAAVVPFHFWLADAHAVAPSPVCALFSGVMVELGLYGLARVYWTVFALALKAHADGVRLVLVGLGVLTAVVGALMCFQQHHLKRQLAFSTVSHMGVVLIGLGLLSPAGTAGAAAYVLAHAPLKASLFLGVGVLLDRFSSVGEGKLKGRGRELPWLGLCFVLGALGLAGAPLVGTFPGKAAMEEAAKQAHLPWLTWVLLFSGAVTGGAVLRASIRVFLGWGADVSKEAKEERREDEREPETKGEPRTSWVMVLVVVLLTLASVAVGWVPHLGARVEAVAVRFVDSGAYAARVMRGEVRRVPAPEQPVEVQGEAVAYGVGSVLGALVLAVTALMGNRAPGGKGLRKVLRGALAPLRNAHSGHVGDYLAWWVVGAACLGGALLLVFR
ncbi:MAG: complex I subunit 5 family protein [Archangium sp.]